MGCPDFFDFFDNCPLQYTPSSMISPKNLSRGVFLSFDIALDHCALGQGIYFEQLLIWFNFNMTSFINIQYFEVKLTHFCQKMYILPKMSDLTPWGAYVSTYPLGQRHLF